jgi:type IV pilus assembly protein PilE
MSSASALERRFSETGSYCEPTACQTANTEMVDPSVGSKTSPVDGNESYYDIKLNAQNKTQYTLYAIPKNAQAQDKCGTLTLTQAGVRNIEKLPSDSSATKTDCW